MKSRSLKDITIKEVSLVDRPANKRSFLLFKQDENASGDSLLKAKKKINIEIESDGTVGGTVITVNGTKVDKLKSFNFDFWEGTDKSAKVNASYSILAEAADGFQRTETYYLAKGVKHMDPKVKELLVKFLGEKFKDVTFEKSEFNDETITELVKSLTIVNEYKEEFPADLNAAIGVLAINASQGYKQEEVVEKAGAKLSKDSLAKIKAAVEAVKALEGMLPKEDDVTDTKKSEAVDSELQKTVEKLAESVAAITSTLEKKETSDQLTKVTEAISAVSDRIKNLEKQPASTKKSVGPEDDDTLDKREVRKDSQGRVIGYWPSLMGSA